MTFYIEMAEAFPLECRLEQPPYFKDQKNSPPFLKVKGGFLWVYEIKHGQGRLILTSLSRQLLLL